MTPLQQDLIKHKQKKNPATTKQNVKYIGLTINDSLSWKMHLKTLLPGLNRATGLLPKIRHLIPKFIFNSLFNL